MFDKILDFLLTKKVLISIIFEDLTDISAGMPTSVWNIVSVINLVAFCDEVIFLKNFSGGKT